MSSIIFGASLLLAVLVFLLILEIFFLLFSKSVSCINKVYNLLKNINNLVYVGNCFYYNFYYTDDKHFWILQYSPRSPKIFRLYKWEDNSLDNKHFYCQLGQPISGIMFHIITNKLDKIIIPLSGGSNTDDIRKEASIMNSYIEFKRISKRKNLIDELM